MATGYTFAVAKGEMSFEQYVWRCAGALNPLSVLSPYEQRTPIEPSLESLDENIRENQERLKELQSKTPKEVEAMYEAQYSDILSDAERRNAERAAKYENYKAMLDRVKAWEPPTTDHEELAQFMIEQLQKSIEFDCKPVEMPERQDPAEWHKMMVGYAKKSLDQSIQNRTREILWAQNATEWIDQLEKSVPKPGYCDES